MMVTDSVIDYDSKSIDQQLDNSNSLDVSTSSPSLAGKYVRVKLIHKTEEGLEFVRTPYIRQSETKYYTYSLQSPRLLEGLKAGDILEIKSSITDDVVICKCE